MPLASVLSQSSLLRNTQEHPSPAEMIFVSALPFKVTANELRSLFEPYGEIRSISLHADWEKAVDEPYALIEMNNAETAIHALDGRIIGSTYLRVNKKAD